DRELVRQGQITGRVAFSETLYGVHTLMAPAMAAVKSETGKARAEQALQELVGNPERLDAVFDIAVIRDFVAPLTTGDEQRFFVGDSTGLRAATPDEVRLAWKNANAGESANPVL